MARPICFRLFTHWVRLAASRTFWTAGSSSAIRMAIMAITTSSSMSVKAGRRRHLKELMIVLRQGSEPRRGKPTCLSGPVGKARQRPRPRGEAPVGEGPALRPSAPLPGTGPADLQDNLIRLRFDVDFQARGVEDAQGRVHLGGRGRFSRPVLDHGHAVLAEQGAIPRPGAAQVEGTVCPDSSPRTHRPAFRFADYHTVG